MLSKIDTLRERGVTDSDCADRTAQIDQLAALLRSRIEKSCNQWLNR